MSKHESGITSKVKKIQSLQFFCTALIIKSYVIKMLGYYWDGQNTEKKLTFINIEKDCKLVELNEGGLASS